MSFRIYLMLLRPVRTLAFTVWHLFLVWGWMIGLWRSDHRLHGFWMWVIAFPLCCGFFFTGPLHEVMHNNFFLLLPDARRRLTLWHGSTMFVCTVIATIIARFFDPSLPAVGVAGLASAVFALPLLNRHDLKYYFLSLGIIIFLALTAYSKVEWPRIMLISHPWMIFCVSLYCVVFCFQRGFCRKNLRIRAGMHYLAPQNSLFDDAVTAPERARFLKRFCSKGKISTSVWLRMPVITSMRDFARAVHHARSGHSKWRAGRIPIFILFLTICLIMSGYPLFFAVIANRPVSIHWLAETLAQIGSIGSGTTLNDPFIHAFSLIMLPVFGLLGAATREPLLRSFPISRHQLSNLDYRLSLYQSGTALFVPFASLIALSWTGAFIAGVPFAWSSVGAYVGLLVFILPITPLVLCTSLSRRFIPRMFGVVGTVVLPIPLSLWVICFHRIYLLTPLCICISLCATAAGLVLFKTLLDRQYARKDLVVRADGFQQTPMFV
ncbi:MAG: hypothetical protein WC378_07090 [Opitutaceae bacterium]|jgi:hypothetical protein